MQLPTHSIWLVPSPALSMVTKKIFPKPSANVAEVGISEAKTKAREYFFI
jgi:hypothetical protein